MNVTKAFFLINKTKPIRSLQASVKKFGNPSAAGSQMSQALHKNNKVRLILRAVMSLIFSCRFVGALKFLGNWPRKKSSCWASYTLLSFA